MNRKLICLTVWSVFTNSIQNPFFIRLINPFVSPLFPTTNAPQDPKTSRWLWDLKERSRQRRRTENYREIMHMQQKIAEPLAKLDHEDETAAARENQVWLLKQNIFTQVRR